MSATSIQLPKGTQIPNHIAIVPDGNRRWARARGYYTLRGHKAGFERAVELARAARKMGVHTVTLWGFSTENWDRTSDEINYLMKLYVKLINDYLKEADKEQVRLVHLGRKDRLPAFLLKKIAEAEEQTKNHTRYIANLAIDYGGIDDIIRATQRIVDDAIPSDQITREKFEQYLDTHGQAYPYVDLIIRTSGEQRTSGLLMWQAEYAEIYWEQSHFPDFTPTKLRDAILDYSRRRRRYGGNDTVEHLKFKPAVTARLEVNWWRLSNIPEGTKFVDYAISHLKEQWGMSKTLTKEAATLMVSAFLDGESKKWRKAQKTLQKFYDLVKSEAKLAFEPALAAKLQVNLWEQASNRDNLNVNDLDETSRQLVSEVYRMSDLQAAKAAHLMSLATVERSLAKNEKDDLHWKKAEDYLEKYYLALKDRVA